MEIPSKANNCWHVLVSFCIVFGHFPYFHVYFKDKLVEILLKAKITSGHSCLIFFLLPITQNPEAGAQ